MAESSRKRNHTKTKKNHNETLEVVCRIAPYNGPDPCLLALDDECVKLVAPIGINKPDQVYKFGCVLDSNDTQRSVFQRCALDFVEDLIHGKNGLLFTYGVTGSGKTFTMTGDTRADKIGILPRSLDVLFNSLPNQLEKCVFYFDKNAVHVRGPSHAQMEREKDPVFESQIDESRYTESKKVYGFNNDYVSAVFVSYVEIYNDECYDLLDDNLSKDRLGFTKCLRKDHANPRAPVYVHEITEKEVQSSDEALTLFLKAQDRRKVAQTMLNRHSSRSHSIFNIKLVMAPCADGSFYPTMDESKIIVSQLSLVDLAGSERSKRTENTGQRFDEGCNINKSLLTLRQCFNQLRDNQRNPRRPGNIISYRDSKLTYLFKSYFEGIGRIRMIICVNPQPEDYQENTQVLQFAEVAQQVDIPEVVSPLFPLSDMANLPFSRRQIDAWHRELDQKVSLEPMNMQLFDPPPSFRHLKAPEDEETIRNLREYFLKTKTQHESYLNTVVQNAEDFCGRLKKRLCYADLNDKRVSDMEIELEEMRKYNTDVTAQANQYKRQLNAMKLRLNRYECEDFVEKEREEDAKKKQRELADAMEKKRKTLQQAMDLVTSPIYPSPQIQISENPTTSHVAALRKQFAGFSEDESLRSGKRPAPTAPPKTPSERGRTPATNPQMTMFGKVDDRFENSSTSGLSEGSEGSLTDSFTSVSSENMHVNTNLDVENRNLHVIRPKILNTYEDEAFFEGPILHDPVCTNTNDWSMLKQPNNLHEINVTQVNFCDGSEENWILGKMDEEMDQKMDYENDMHALGEHTLYKEIMETQKFDESIMHKKNEFSVFAQTDLPKPHKTSTRHQSPMNPMTENDTIKRSPLKERQLMQARAPPSYQDVKKSSTIRNSTPSRQKVKPTCPELVPFGMPSAPRIRRSIHVGPKHVPIRSSLMTKMSSIREVDHSSPATNGRRYQKNTSCTPTRLGPPVKPVVVRRRSKSAQPGSMSKSRPKTTDGHESDPEFVKVYKKMEQKKAQKMLNRERLI